MILFIDTSDFNRLRLALIDPARKFAPHESFHAVAYNENYKTAAFLQKFLRTNKLTPADLSKIIVCSGPGSFTGIRVGVALAQALGFALHLPVLVIKKGQVPSDLARLSTQKTGKTLVLNYGRRPNVTAKKAK